MEYDNAHSQAYIANRNPAAGEQKTYAPVMDRNAISAYSVVAYLPNPSKTGTVIILAGTDSDATGGAAEFLASEDALRGLQDKYLVRKLAERWSLRLKYAALPLMEFVPLRSARLTVAPAV